MNSLGRQDFVVDVVQRGTVGHMKGPEQGAPLLLDLLCLKHHQREVYTFCL